MEPDRRDGEVGLFDRKVCFGRGLEYGSRSRHETRRDPNREADDYCRYGTSTLLGGRLCVQRCGIRLDDHRLLTQIDEASQIGTSARKSRDSREPPPVRSCLVPLCICLWTLQPCHLRILSEAVPKLYLARSHTVYHVVSRRRCFVLLRTRPA